MDEKLRLECLKFVVNQDKNYNFPVYQMLEAEMLYQYVKNGTLPMSGNRNASVEIEKLLSASFELLNKEVNDSNQSADSCNSNSDGLQIPESFVKRFLSKLRRK